MSSPRESGVDIEPRTHIDMLAAPDAKITEYASWLAFLEKVASGLSKLAFIWATVVVLGGYAITIQRKDFWFVTILLLMEGIRIVSRSYELELLENNSCGVQCVPCTGRRVPGTGRLLIVRNLSDLLFSIQNLTVLASVGLSVYSLWKHHYGVVSDNSTKNRKSVLIIFYVLSLADASVYMIEKMCWMVSERKLIPKVTVQYGFQANASHEIHRFLYDKYSSCINVSFSEGLNMNFLSYSVDLLLSSGHEKQLRGARLLSTLAKNDRFREELSMAIGAMREVLERLIEMLNWQHSSYKDIRKAAAEIVSNMSRTNGNLIQVTALARCMESIASLLYNNTTMNSRQHDGYDHSSFNVLGLQILKGFLEQQAIMESNIIDILPKIIRLTKLNPKVGVQIQLNPKVDRVQFETVQLALELVKMFMQSHSSRILKDMNENALEIRNLVDVLQYREASTSGPQTLIVDIDTSDQHGRAQDPLTISSLQILAINALKMFAEHHLRISEADKGALSHLFSVFLMGGINNNGETTELVNKAGETLHLLSLKNEKNCQLMMSVGKDCPSLMTTLISLLDDPLRGIVVAKILRNLFEYTEADCVELREISAVAAAKVVVVVRERQDEHQEAAIGLAARIFKIIAKSDFDRALQSNGVTTRWLISELLKVLQRRRAPSTQVLSREVPIMSFSVELLTAVIKLDKDAILNSVSREVRVVLARELHEVSIKSAVFPYT